MSSRSSRRRAALASVAMAVATVLLGSSAAWAAPEGRIQEVTSQPGAVTFVLSAEGLAEGESINAASVKTTIAGIDAATTAAPISGAAEAPVARTTMLVLDSSGSMAEFGKLDTAKAAANQYLDGLPADVSAGLISFADNAEVKVAPTQDREAVRAAIAGLKAEGSTALNDAVALGVTELGDQGSRNMVLLSDGEDEGSETSAKAARKASREFRHRSRRRVCRPGKPAEGACGIREGRQRLAGNRHRCERPHVRLRVRRSECRHPVGRDCTGTRGG